MQMKKPHVPLSAMHELVMNQDSLHFSQMFLALSSALVRDKAKNVPIFHQHPLVYGLELGETPFMCTFMSCTAISNYALPPMREPRHCKHYRKDLNGKLCGSAISTGKPFERSLSLSVVLYS